MTFQDDDQLSSVHALEIHYETERKVLQREKTEERARQTQLSSTVQNLISSVTLIFSQSQSSTLRSDVEFVNLLIKFIIIVAAAVSAEIYVMQRLMKDKIAFGLLAFKVLLAIIQIVRSYFMYLLLTIIRDQISSTVADELWESFNLIPAIIIIVLYLTIREITQDAIAKRL